MKMLLILMFAYLVLDLAFDKLFLDELKSMKTECTAPRPPMIHYYPPETE